MVFEILRTIYHHGKEATAVNGVELAVKIVRELLLQLIFITHIHLVMIPLAGMDSGT